MNINLYAKRVYGVIRYYPDCPLSKAIAGIKRLPTLTHGDLTNLQSAGLTVNLSFEDGSTAKGLTPEE